MAFKVPTFTIVQDTDEKLPWSFGDRPVCIKKLQTADYSIQGMEHLVAIERKSLSDLLKTLTKGRKQFMREMERMQGHELRAIIVEAHWEDAYSGNYRSKMLPASLLGTIAAIQAKYNVPTHFCGDHAANWALHLMYHFVRCKAKEQAAIWSECT